MMKRTLILSLCVFMMSFVSVRHLFAAEDMPGLQVGAIAPDFTAVTHEGEQVVLSELYAQGPVVLVFYRGAWCPYCNIHLKQFQNQLSEFEAKGATILGVSVDLKEYANKAVVENGLGFDVISDPQADILKAYGLIFTVPDELADVYKNQYKIDLQKHSGRSDNVISIPATYLIDQAGTIQFAFASEDYKLRAKPEDVLAALA